MKRSNRVEEVAASFMEMTVRHCEEWKAWAERLTALLKCDDLTDEERQQLDAVVENLRQQKIEV